jgi:hypothetical protein
MVSPFLFSRFFVSKYSDVGTITRDVTSFGNVPPQIKLLKVTIKQQ